MECNYLSLYLAKKKKKTSRWSETFYCILRQKKLCSLGEEYYYRGFEGGSTTTNVTMSVLAEQIHQVDSMRE